jgi:NAD(P)-dependent dehydrogenase (short-subunit alcohol dehydrogenase family)
VRLAGKTATVTGGGGGIGGAIAERLAGQDVHVVVADIDGAAAGAVAAKINEAHPGAAVAAAGDVADEQCIQGLIDLAASTTRVPGSWRRASRCARRTSARLVPRARPVVTE